MKGKNRCDLTQLLREPSVFSSLINDMAEPFHSRGISSVVALDAMGFGLGGAVAHLLKAGLVLARKKGRSAWTAESVKFSDYSATEKSLEIVTDALKPNDNVLIVDDWSETGAQLKAAIQLIEKFGAAVVGISCINIEQKVKDDKAFNNYELYSVMEY